MIYFYSGTPGSGKSLRVARDIMNKLIVRKQNVITNMDVDYNYIRTSKFKVRANRLTFKLFKKIFLKIFIKKLEDVITFLILK